MKSWVEISEERLAANYSALVSVAGEGMPVLAVIKADAYGHGAALCAPVLARAGATWLGVADVEEGAVVRASLSSLSAERQPRILVMSGLRREDAEAVVRHSLTPIVWNCQQMEWLAEAVVQAGASPLAVHLEIDTGMARQGVVPGDDLAGLLSWFKEQSDLHLDGLMTHFVASEVAGSPLTLRQRARFEQAQDQIASTGLYPAWVHAANSSTVDNSSAGGSDQGSLQWLREAAARIGSRAMARAGLALYGYCLPVEDGEGLVAPHLAPVMTWKTHVIAVHDLEAGDTVGYNATFTAPRPMRLALLPVGYSDGLRRDLSSSNATQGGWVMVRGHRAMIVGRISMNLTVVDVTGIPDAGVDDEVVLLGGGVTADDHARIAHTIAYEILCGVRPRSRLLAAG